MPRKKHSELVAGLFVVAALGLLLFVVLWLGAADLFVRARQRACFVAHHKDGVMGLEEGSPAIINDVIVGKITEIRLVSAKHQTLYFVEITDPKAEIHSDGKAHPYSPFVGSVRLAITDCGTTDAPLADEQNPIKLGRGGLMGNIAAMSDQLRDEMDPKKEHALLAKVHAIFDVLKATADNVMKVTDGIRREADASKVDSILCRLRKSLEDVNAVTASIRAETDPKQAKSMLAKVHTTLDRVDKAAADVQSVTADVKPKIKKIITDVAETTGKIKELTKSDVAEILANLRKASTPMLEAVKNLSDLSRQVAVIHRDNIDEILDNLAQVSVNLKSTSKEVRRNPWKLFYEPKEAEERSSNIAEAARAFSTGAAELDQAITKLAALAKLHPKGIPPDDTQLKEIRKQIEESFARFNRVEEALWKSLVKRP